MQKDGSIVISDFQKGVSQSPVLGTETIIGCEIFDEIGLLKIKEAPQETNEYINTVMGFDLGVCVARQTNENNEICQLTENGYLFYKDISGDSIYAINLTKGWDVCIWNNTFALVSYAQAGVGYIGVMSRTTGTVWHPNRVSGLTGTHAIKMMKAQDGHVYFTNGNKIGRITNISESAGVVTITSTSNALNFPNDIYTVAITELGNDLIIGTQKGAYYTSRNSYNFANIYKWDRVSSSFRLPVQINENGINAMVQKDNKVYVSAGLNGNIYLTDGTNYQLIKTLPFTKVKKFGATSTVLLNAMNFTQEGTLLIGLSTNTDTTPNTLSKFGVWEIGLSSGYPTTLSYVARNGSTGQDNALYIGFVASFGVDGVIYSTRQTNVYEVLYTDFRTNTGYLSTYESQVYIVGTRNNRKSFNSLEFTLTEPLIAGQGIKIAYRKNLTASYTDIGTWDFTTLGGLFSHETKALIANAEMVQFQIKLTQNTSTSFPSNVKLLRVIVK